MTSVGESLSTVIASFRVPDEPRARDMGTEYARDAWRHWLQGFRIYLKVYRVPSSARRCRVVATVRRCEGPRYYPVTAAILARWEDGVREAVVRSGIVPEALLVGVDVRFEVVKGVPLAERPKIDGTQIEILES